MSSILLSKEGTLTTPEQRGNFTVCVVGCGRMGLPHACLFAEAGFKVVGVEIEPQALASIKRGKAPFSEPGVNTILSKHIKHGYFTATDNAVEAAKKSDIFFICVQTPIDQKRKPDYSYIENACKNVGQGIRRGTLIISGSTVGPGITETVVKETLENSSGLKAGKDFGLAFSPIRATANRVLQDIVNYPRIVGAIDKRSLRVASQVLSTIIKGKIIEVKDIKTAETAKLFENIYRDVALALTNEFALLCEKIGVDYLEAQKAAITNPYCHILIPGFVSGHIPKDPYLLINEAENLNVKMRMTLISREINDSIVNHTVNLVREALKACGKPFRHAKIAVLGIAYRANTKEHKGSLTKTLIDMLKKKETFVKVYDPLYSVKELKDIGYEGEKTITKTVEGTDCLIITVAHERFTKLNLKKISLLMKKPPAIVDVSHTIEPEKAEKEGFIYRGLGRGVWKK
jgi:nucleotide sugar dehydrogenase